MKTRQTKEVSRRGFIGTIGAAAAATALPLFPALARQPAPQGNWPGAVSTHADGFRAAYLAELVRFAESLRPRFESGELRNLST